MGWASGSILLDDVAKVVMPAVPKTARHKLALKLIEVFEGEDCDTINECEQKDIQEAYDELYPPDHEYEAVG